MFRKAVLTGICLFLVLQTSYGQTCDEQLPAGVSALKGHKFSCADPKDPKFQYEVGICVNLKKEDAGGMDSAPGAIQIETKENEDERSVHSLGQITHADFMAGTNWVKMEYREGDKYHSHCQQEGRRTVVLIVCQQYETQGHLQLLEENKNKTAECYYLFELSHSSVCSMNQPTSLGLGAIISIVFFVAVGVYLILGFLYQRFVVHAQGKEQIPHYPFWQDVGNLAADGCNVVFRSDGRRNSDGKQYRGIGDDQLRSTPIESTSDTDEHLLPM